MRFSVILILLINAFIVDAFKQHNPSNFFFKSITSKTIKKTVLKDAGGDCGPCPLAPKCNGGMRAKGIPGAPGCDGTGKIQGGIATIPFLGWWPIKVFRPCPSYLAAGYQYKREGQTMDQVLFSEPSTKQRESMELKKLEKEKAELQLERETEAAEAVEKVRATIAGEIGNLDEKSKASAKGVDLTDAEKFLNDTFGG